MNIPEDEQALIEEDGNDKEAAADKTGDEVDDAECDYGYDGACSNNNLEDGKEFGEEDLGPEDGKDKIREDKDFEGMEGFAPL